MLLAVLLVADMLDALIRGEPYSVPVELFVAMAGPLGYLFGGALIRRNGNGNGKAVNGDG